MSIQLSNDAAKKLLKKLLEVNSMIYIGLSVLEQNIRIAISATLKSHLGSRWLVDNITSTGIPLFKEEANLIIRRKGSRFVLNEEKFLQECSMGFWVELFNPQTYKRLKGIPIQALANRPATLKRNEFYRRFKALKDLRNDLVHSRLPIATDIDSVLQFTDKLEIADAETRELLSYINPAATQLLPTGLAKKLAVVRKIGATIRSPKKTK